MTVYLIFYELATHNYGNNGIKYRKKNPLVVRSPVATFGVSLLHYKKIFFLYFIFLNVFLTDSLNTKKPAPNAGFATGSVAAFFSVTCAFSAFGVSATTVFVGVVTSDFSFSFSSVPLFCVATTVVVSVTSLAST